MTKERDWRDEREWILLASALTHAIETAESAGAEISSAESTERACGLLESLGRLLESPESMGWN